MRTKTCFPPIRIWILFFTLCIFLLSGPPVLSWFSAPDPVRISRTEEHFDAGALSNPERFESKGFIAAE
ncbi:MAG: hypothetical protein JW937_01855, partial [Candidatus Omnitrophica bacterium]|nr:hypothetical protein [Candidatus Omnitrophota bacterium]